MFNLEYYHFLFMIIPFWIIFRMISFKNRVDLNRNKEIITNISFIYILVILRIVDLFPILIGFPKYYDFPIDHNLIPFKSIKESLSHSYYLVPLRNILGNVLLLLPLGLLLPLLSDKISNIKDILIKGMLVSITLEFLQFSAPWRVANIDNVLLHTIGVFLGFYMYKILSSHLRKFFNSSVA
jgi:glycopeptide antibiotics resistance protein